MTMVDDILASIPEESTTGQAPLDEINHMASDIGGAIDTAEAMAREGDRVDIEAARDLLDNQKKNVDRMGEIAENLPELPRATAIGVIADTDERLKNAISEIDDLLQTESPEESSIPLSEINRMAADIGASIDTAESMARKEGRPDIEGAKNLLENQKKTLDQMNDLAETLPEMPKAEAICIIADTDERLKNAIRYQI